MWVLTGRRPGWGSGHWAAAGLCCGDGNCRPGDGSCGQRNGTHNWCVKMGRGRPCMLLAVHHVVHVTGDTWRYGLRRYTPPVMHGWVSSFPETATAQPGSDRARNHGPALCVRAWLPCMPVRSGFPQECRDGRTSQFAVAPARAFCADTPT